VRTDNSAVRYWQSLSLDAHGQAFRWMMQLMEYNMEMVHRPGKEHSNADGMSRGPFVRCAQCDVVHPDAKPTKRARTVSRVTQTDGGCEQQPVRHVGEVRTVSSSGFRSSRGMARNHPWDPCRADLDPDWRRTARPDTSGVMGGVARALPEEGATGEPQGTPDKQERVTSGDGGLVPPVDAIGGGDAVLRHSQTHGRAKEVLVTTRLKRTRNAPDAQTVTWAGRGVPISRELVREEQSKDPACADAISWLEQGEKPSREEILRLGEDHKFLWGNLDVLEVAEGVLQRRMTPSLSGLAQVSVVVPPSLRQKVIQLCHRPKTAGHFYYWKTLKTIKRHFVWPGMSRQVQTFCRACEVCATRKNAGRKQKAPMRRYDVGMPMEEIAIDLMGPFPESNRGNKYVLVLVDSYSKWMEAYAIPNMEAKTVAEKLVQEFFSRFGVPLFIKSDRGRQFECELFKELCCMYEMEHSMSSPRHPEGNSRVERMVKVVGNLIAAFCTSQKEWDEDLLLLTMAYRSTVYYNLQRHGEEYGPGDLIYMRDLNRKKGVCPKLGAKWKGPYIIRRKLGTCYEVQLSRSQSKVFHFDLLKPCYMAVADLAPWQRKVVKQLGAGVASQ